VRRRSGTPSASGTGCEARSRGIGPTRTSGTLGHLLRESLDQHPGEKETVADYRFLAESFIIPALGSVKLTRLTQPGPVEIRKLIYTTNRIESLNARFRQAVRRRGHVPTEQAALTVLYLTVRERRPNRTNPTGKINGWKSILNTLSITLRQWRPPRWCSIRSLTSVASWCETATA
jgi:hypothetical protein